MPRDTLTREQIVQAAIDLMDTDGLEGLNMRSLGARLDSAATAVYWHVGSKENLISLASDKAWNEIALPDLTRIDWRTAATSTATALHAMLTRHPWLVQAFGAYVTYGPGKARYDDCTLGIYEAAGFSAAQADQAAAAVFTYVLGNALGPAAASSLTRKLARDGGNARERMRRRMAKATQVATTFPRLRARLGTAAASYAAPPDNSFEFGLRAILDGVAAQLVAHRKHATPPSPGTPNSPRSRLQPRRR